MRKEEEEVHPLVFEPSGISSIPKLAQRHRIVVKVDLRYQRRQRIPEQWAQALEVRHEEATLRLRREGRPEPLAELVSRRRVFRTDLGAGRPTHEEPGPAQSGL